MSLEVRLCENLKEITQFDWENLNDSESMDFTLLIKNPKQRKRKVDVKLLEDAFCVLHDQYNKLTKNEHQIEKLIVLMQQLIEARFRCASGDKSEKNWVNQYEAMLEELTKPDEDFDIIRTRMSIQQAYGMAINVKEISAYEFVQITNLVQDQAAANTTNTNKDGDY
jgi:hypothetical protein